LHSIPNYDAIQNVWCRCESDEMGIVNVDNHTRDQNSEPTSEPSDPTEFYKTAKALQDLIFPEPPSAPPVS
jgi:hypothetical protein